MEISDTITLDFRNANAPGNTRTQIQCTVLDHARLSMPTGDLVVAVRTGSHELYVAILNPMGSTDVTIRVENAREAARLFNKVLTDCPI